MPGVLTSNNCFNPFVTISLCHAREDLQENSFGGISEIGGLLSLYEYDGLRVTESPAGISHDNCRLS